MAVLSEVVVNLMMYHHRLEAVQRALGLSSRQSDLCRLKVSALEGKHIVAVEDVAIVVLTHDLNSYLRGCKSSFLG